MDEVEEVRKSANKFQKSARDVKIELAEFKGKLSVWEKSGSSLGQTAAGHVGAETFEAIIQRDEEMAKVLSNLAAWMKRSEEESARTRGLLTKLLGLEPDSPKEEIDQAVDQVGEIISRGRRKLSGGS